MYYMFYLKAYSWMIFLYVLILITFSMSLVSKCEINKEHKHMSMIRDCEIVVHLSCLHLQGPATAVAFSQNGEYFASGGSDEQVRTT